MSEDIIRDIKRDPAIWLAIGEPFFSGLYFYRPIARFLSDQNDTIADECALLSILKDRKCPQRAECKTDAMNRYYDAGYSFYGKAVIQHFCFRYVFWYNDMFTTEARRTALNSIATDKELGQLLALCMIKEWMKTCPRTYFKVPEDFQLTETTLLNVLYDYLIRKKEDFGILQDPTIFEKYAEDEELQKFKKGGSLHSLVPSKDDIQKHCTRELHLFFLEQPNYLSKEILDTSNATDRRKGLERFLAIAKLFY
jgi:hypothetical protein